MSQWSTYILCIMPYNVLSFCDFFCSVLSIWVTLIAMATLKPPLAQLAHTFGMVTLAMGVEWDRHNFLVNAMPAIVGLIIVAVSWVSGGLGGGGGWNGNWIVDWKSNEDSRRLFKYEDVFPVYGLPLWKWKDDLHILKWAQQTWFDFNCKKYCGHHLYTAL